MLGIVARSPLSRRLGPRLLGPLLILLIAGAPAAGDDLEWEAEDGSFPAHGGCTYFGPRDGRGLVGTAADDLAAMVRRARDTRRVVAMLPQPRYMRAPVRAAGDETAPISVPCTGIDDCIQRTAQAAGLPLAGLTTDAEFLRRVRLDLTGRIPTQDEVLAFLADTSVDKRERLVDRLLMTPEWSDRWAMFLGDLIRNTRRTAQVNRYPLGRDSLHLFLLESLRENKPYDQLARELVSAEGTSDGRAHPRRYTDYNHWYESMVDLTGNPVRPSPVSYVVGGRTTGGPVQDTYDSLAFFVARDFLGLSLMDCVLCHDGAGFLDSLSVWGQRAKRLDGWRLAAFFSDVPRFQEWVMPANQRPINPENNRRVQVRYYRIRDLEQGRVRQTRRGDTAGEYLAQTSGGNRPDRRHGERFVEPLYPFGGEASVDASLRLREQVGWHLTADPQFARAAVNYVWKEFFSRGIVEPPDQFDLHRLDPGAPPPEGWQVQPSHPQLLEQLAQEFRDNGFDLKWLMREITTSSTYQLSSRYEGAYNPTYERYFVRRQAKRLSAEQVHDAILVATGRGASYFVSPLMRGIRFAMQFPDVVGLPLGRGPSPSSARQLLDAFTRGDREETARSTAGSPLQAMNLMNNPFVLNRIVPGGARGTLADSLGLPDDGLVASLYLSVLGRHPTEHEMSLALAHLGEGDRDELASDLLWMLLNKTDFYFNY